MNSVLFKSILITTTLVFAVLVSATTAKADITTTSFGSARVLQQALATRDGLNIYDSKSAKGLNFSGGLFSGRASGIDPIGTNFLSSGNDHSDRTAELEGDARVHALMIDGKYNFENIFGSASHLRPYLSSGVGVAVYDYGSLASATNMASQNGNTVPLFRVGGGVNYQLGDSLNVSLDYKAGITGGDNASLSRSQATNMQSINMGMHFSF